TAGDDQGIFALGWLRGLRRWGHPDRVLPLAVARHLEMDGDRPVAAVLGLAESDQVAAGVIEVDRRDECVIELTWAGAGHRDRDVQRIAPLDTHRVEVGARIDRSLERGDMRPPKVSAAVGPDVLIGRPEGRAVSRIDLNGAVVARALAIGQQAEAGRGR